MPHGLPARSLLLQEVLRHGRQPFHIPGRTSNRDCLNHLGRLGAANAVQTARPGPKLFIDPGPVRLATLPAPLRGLSPGLFAGQGVQARSLNGQRPPLFVLLKQPTNT